MYFLIVCRLVFLFSSLCAVWQKTRSQNHPKSFSLYFLIVCRLVFLFSSLCAVWQKTRSQNHPSKLIFFVFSFSLAISSLCAVLEIIFYVFYFLFIFFTLCRLAENKIAKSHVRVTSKLIFFVFPHCVPASLFIFFTMCRLAENKIAKSSKIIFFVFPHCVPASLFIFFTMCRLAENKIAKSQETIFVNSFSIVFRKIAGDLIFFYFLGAVCHSERVSPHCTSAPRACDLEIIFYVFPHCVPASLFIFFTLCRLAENKIAKSGLQINFLCISSLCAGSSKFIWQKTRSQNHPK